MKWNPRQERESSLPAKQAFVVLFCLPLVGIGWEGLGLLESRV